MTVGCANYSNEAITFDNTDNFKSLNKVSYPEVKASYSEVNDDDINAINTFSYRTSTTIMDMEKNNIYSPISLYIALSMLGEGISNENALDQMNNLLGNTSSTRKLAINTIYNNDYYANSNGTLKMANSMWIDNNFTVDEEYCNVLSNDYYAEIYHTDFDDVGHENIVKWINYYTNNFLDLTKEKYEVDPELVVLLLNTIYFDNKWNLEFNKEDNVNADFYLQDGSTVGAEYMFHSVTSKYYEGSNYVMTTDKFKNDSTVTYVLPNEGVDLVDVSNDESIFTTSPGMDGYTVNLTIPKFKYFSDYELNDSLKELGVTDIFYEGSLEGIGSKDLYVDYVKQNAGIEFSESGVKAAAVTSIGLAESSAPIFLSVTLNRPFIYIIKDKAGVPLFVGTMINPTTE